MDVLETMTTYVRVVEAGSFSAAAKQLRLSAAAVSRQVAMLEGHLGAPLLLRSTRRMAVTDAGHRYYERALVILREVDEAQASARGGDLAGVLKVSAPVTFGLATIVAPLRTLMVQHPELSVDLRLEDRMVDLVLDGVDLAIRIRSGPPETTEIIAHRMMVFRRVMVAAPAYLAKHGAPEAIEDLAGHAALSHAIDSDHWRLVHGDRAVRAPIHLAFRSNAGHAILELALAGAGIALLPDWFVAPHLRARRLRAVLPAWTGEPTTVHALHRTIHRGEPRVRTLIDHLRAAWASYG